MTVFLENVIYKVRHFRKEMFSCYRQSTSFPFTSRTCLTKPFVCFCMRSTFSTYSFFQFSSSTLNSTVSVLVSQTVYSGSNLRSFILYPDKFLIWSSICNHPDYHLPLPLRNPDLETRFLRSYEPVGPEVAHERPFDRQQPICVHEEELLPGDVG